MFPGHELSILLLLGVSDTVAVGTIGAVVAGAATVTVAYLGRTRPKPKLAPITPAALTFEERKHLDGVTAGILDRYAKLLDECEERNEALRGEITELRLMHEKNEAEIATLKINIRSLGGVPPD